MSGSGIVYLVGAGPGDPELLTLKGKRLLQAAEVVVFDRLVDVRTLALARPDAEMIDVGKVPGDPKNRQEDITAILIAKAKEGKNVVRLKGGDPYVFGRGGEEALGLVGEGLRFQEVPAPSSGIVAPAYAGIPVTHRGLATSVTFVTGNEDPTKAQSTVNWDAVANTGGTVVVYMGRDNLHRITNRFIEAGRSPDTPAALVRWGSEPAQRTLTGTLYDIAARADDAELPPPVVLVIGDVVKLQPSLNWFENLPLFGKRVLVTRTRQQAGVLSASLTALGALPIEVPTIEVEPLAPAALDRAIDDMATYDWTVFTSANAAEIFFDRLPELGLDARVLGKIKVAAIGPATAAEVKRRGVIADAVPPSYVGEALGSALAGHDLSGKRVLLPRAEAGRDAIVTGLTALGATVDDVPIYRTVTPANAAELLEKGLADGIDIATFTSSSTVTNLMDLVGDRKRLRGVTIACIGPITGETAGEHGLSVDIVASEFTVEGLVDALVAHFGSAPK
jgi:uroporphyrinogen III methyltransferase / synthase